MSPARVTRERYEDAADVGSIRYRLAPIDVGWNLRAEGVAVLLEEPDAEPVRVSYADDDGERWVLAGPAGEVRAELVRLGFAVRDAEGTTRRRAGGGEVAS